MFHFIHSLLSGNSIDGGGTPFGMPNDSQHNTLWHASGGPMTEEEHLERYASMWDNARWIFNTSRM